MLLAYLLGVLVGEYARDWLDPSGAISDRAFLLVPAIPMMAVWLILRLGGREHHLHVGDWSNGARWFGQHGRRVTWAHLMIGALALVGLPLVTFSALSVRTAFGSAPNLGSVLATVAALSLLNAFIEELLFRGLIQPGLVSYLGTKRGCGYRLSCLDLSTSARVRPSSRPFQRPWSWSPSACSGEGASWERGALGGQSRSTQSWTYPLSYRSCCPARPWASTTPTRPAYQRGSSDRLGDLSQWCPPPAST